MADPGSASTAPQDPFEMFRRLWGPLGVPVPGMAMPTMDPQEIEKRITELKSVEMWLNMNLNMLRGAIQGLEMQKAGLQQMQGMQQGMQQAMQQAMNMAMPPQDPKQKKP
jgi:exonuclease VII small subunit